MLSLTKCFYFTTPIIHTHITILESFTVKIICDMGTYYRECKD